jgi:predicted LPLAT superfamily acyltransferase
MPGSGATSRRRRVSLSTIAAERIRAFDAKLILLLANHVGDAEVLREAMAAAAQGITRVASPSAPAKSQ